jgi:hypothetical protein
MLGMTARIRKPLWKECPLCGRSFLESSLPSALIVRLGIDGVDFCSPCLSSVVLQGTGNSSMSKEGVLEYFRSLTNTIQQVPHQGYGEGREDLRYMDKDERAKTIGILKNKPTAQRVQKLFGSWRRALVE